MGRAIVREPSVFLMDEPLSNLDAKLRVETRANIAALQHRLGTTTIYVTHDQVEAMTMGHRVAVLKDGMLQQCDTPRALYDRPANAFVAGFIGSPAMNLKTLPLHADGAELDGIRVPLSRTAMSAASAEGLTEIVFGVRPESLRLADSAEGGFDMIVELVEELGADAYVHGAVRLGDTSERFVVRVDGRTPPVIGQEVKVAVRDADEIHLFHPETGLRLES
jgi:multiple sugar transport system ATP-binding protein